MRWLTLTALVAAALLVTAPSLRADTALDPRVLAVHLTTERGDILLADALLAYLDADGSVLLPLAELATCLDLAITVDAPAGTATGWILTEERRFHLDSTRREAWIDGRAQAMGDHRIHAELDELYVASPLLERWLPVDLRVDLELSTIRVTPREALPGQRRAHRLDARRQLRRATEAKAPSEPAPGLALPYRWLDWPLLDIELGADVSGAGGKLDLTGHATLAASADLLGLSARLLATGDSRGLGRTRLSLGRRSVEGRLFGALPATELVVGDLTAPSVPLLPAGGTGRGVLLSNRPLDRPADFDRSPIEGETLPGWEVELYRNGIFLDFLDADADGRFRFEDVPLGYGLNRIELRLFGPHGESRRQIRRWLIGPGLIRPGELHYRVLAMDGGSLLGDRSGDATGSRRLSLEVERGLHRRLSLRGTVAELGHGETRRRHATAGFCFTSAAVFGRFDVAADDAGGQASRFGLQAHLRGLDLSLEHDRRERRPMGDAESSRRDRLSLGGSLRLGTGRRLAFRLNAEQRRAVEDRERRLGLRLSARVRRIHLTHDLHVTERSADERPTETELAGLLRWSGSWRRLRLRGTTRYRLEPVARLDRLSASVARDVSERLRGRLDVSHDASAGTSRLGVHIDRRFAGFVLGVGGELSSRGEVSAKVSLSLGLGREPDASRWHRRPDPVTSGGMVMARIFLDHDGDGRFGVGDAPIEGARIDGRSGSRVSDVEGVAVVTGLPAHGVVELSLDEGSLVDPSWRPVRRRVRLPSRPGPVAWIDFPVVECGEVEGTVFQMRDGGQRSVARARLQLIDQNGLVVAETVSAFDGFYLFDGVLPGRYAVRLAPEQAARLELGTLDERPVDVVGGQIAHGVDLSLGRAR